ncbi:MAG: carboxylating nicotinate-nucleotide diphosphorylase [bacterium]
METPETPREHQSVPRTITPLTIAAMSGAGMLRFPLKQEALDVMVRSALHEDGAFNDITTIATVVSDRRSRATLVARAKGVVCGVPLALDAFRLLDPKVSIRVEHEDGVSVTPGEPVLFVTGHARGLLSAERVALNYMQRLSGIATLTARYVEAVKGTDAKILDTRKTTPGWRVLEKYAVRAGGGTNHRMDLSTGVLIKDNHLAALDGDVAKAVTRARELAPAGVKVEVECDHVEQVVRAIDAGADIVLLDNMSPAELTQCVAIGKGKAVLEASGGVTLTTIRAIAETGVDWISVGALTHSAPAMDLALDFE